MSIQVKNQFTKQANVSLAKIVAIALALGVSSATSAELVIGFIDTARAISESDEGKALLAQIELELAEDQARLEALQEEFETLRRKLETDGEIMSDDERRRHQKLIEDNRTDFQFELQKYQRELQESQQEVLEEMAPKVNAALADLIELEGMDMVFERQVATFVNPKHDITRRITEKLNEKQ
ncbi:MAG: OmpH family outer membrane protein [Gammaproteobacteria bacterium]|nr:OmpH family outer membrane protein [Gammaproteobacteria bacterium]MCY4198698.1 OmpH family outer membrane protein [Gammaproteobacteria bacterium]MCY4278284.1 OmpH family outer membrane protein [Gammaproteobacteria bacterium]MCY4324321.1 OmpH family outer membrane protein [Gammaproteobacteria bacterium]